MHGSHAYCNLRQMYDVSYTNLYFMTIKEAQQRVDQWINTTGVRYFSELTNLALLMEEVGEMARIIARRYGEQSEKESDKGKDLGDEMADVLFVLICLANQTGIDLTEAFLKNIEKKSVRDALRHINNPKLHNLPPDTDSNNQQNI